LRRNEIYAGTAGGPIGSTVRALTTDQCSVGS
jgi:hypothetical protein